MAKANSTSTTSKTEQVATVTASKTNDANDNSELSTSQQTFYTCNGFDLFAVRAGVNVETALEQASCFLDVARVSAYEAGESGATNHTDSAAWLIEMSKALVDSALSAMIKAKRSQHA